jgi:hypothetical protein
MRALSSGEFALHHESITSKYQGPLPGGGALKPQAARSAGLLITFCAVVVVHFTVLSRLRVWDKKSELLLLRRYRNC